MIEIGKWSQRSWYRLLQSNTAPQMSGAVFGNAERVAVA